MFNSHHFWECHEELEDHWLEDVGDQARLVYWVIIQVATALYHHGSGNDTGAKDMLKKALAKKQRMKGLGIETNQLENIGWSQFVHRLEAMPLEPSRADFEKLGEFKFQLKKE